MNIYFLVEGDTEEKVYRLFGTCYTKLLFIFIKQY
jgi:hypothetical protein